MAQIYLDNFVNLNKKSYIRPGYRVEYTDELIPVIEIRDAKKGTRFYIEPAHGTSPVIKQSALPSGPAWSYSMTELNDIRRERNGGDSPVKKMGFFASFVASLGSTADARAAGISPDYLTATALGDGVAMMVSNRLEGKVFCLQSGEVPFLVRPGSFIMCEQGVVLGTKLVDSSRFTTDVTGFTHWVEISGEGLCFLQAGREFRATELEPGEYVSCPPGIVMGMTDSVKIVRVDPVRSALYVRDGLGAQYELILQADDRGGIVCVSDMPSDYYTL